MSMILVNILFLIDRGNNGEPENNSDGEFNIDFDEIKQDCKNVNTDDSKMIFIYQSTEMQQMFHRYGNQLILLDATYKTAKYALPLFFLVVKTKVHFQVCRVIVLQEESVDMITRALSVVKMWNPEVIPKYAFVDFDEREISSLEIVYPSIQVYLCDFDREQA